MANYLTTDTDLTSVANAIRTKGGTSAALAFPADFVSAIAAIPSGGGDTFLQYLKSTLETFNDASVTTLFNYAFANSTGFGSIVLPGLAGGTGTNNYKFSGLSNLEVLDLGPDFNAFGTNTFRNVNNLKKLILRRTSGVVSLAANGNLGDTSFNSNQSGATLYVPASLVSSYESATTWSTYLAYANNKIKSIESTANDPTETVDLTTHYGDGTPI